MSMDPELSYSLPSPTDTPYRTPSSSQSLRSRQYDDMSPSSTPPPMPEDRASKRRSQDSDNPALDETISPLDPRRFTPTLHASLVSEILSLRRDLDSRADDIEKLEMSLHAAQTQNGVLNNNLLQANKETRSVKRQMQLLEGGTLSALNELAKERDDSLNDVSDLRRRLEQSQAKVKTQEERVERTQASWDKDKEAWLAERRGLETKVHIAEGRLKVVLSEVANANQAPPVSPTERTCHSRNSVMESPSKASILTRRGRRHSATSVNSDVHGGRVSVMSFHNGVSTNLADELAFDELEEDMAIAHENDDGRISPDALPEEQIRPASSLSLKARKILGLPLDFEDLDRNPSPEHDNSNTNPLFDGIRQRISIKYVDTAIQFSPPPSPWPISESPQKPNQHRPVGVQTSNVKQINANHSPVSPIESIEFPWSIQKPVMVSSACQTVEALPSPPLTPEKREAVLPTIPESTLERIETATTGTQTDPIATPTAVDHSHKHTASEETLDLRVPLIAIIPPGSRPATPETHVVLPPRTKNAGTQVSIQSLAGYSSTSMQTEEIRVDKRSIVPPSEMPPAPLSTHFRPPISSRAAPPPISRSRTPPVAPMFGSRRSVPGPSKAPPLNDNGPLTKDMASNMPRPVRSSSLFAGFDDDSESRDDLFGEDNFHDDDIFSRPTAKFTLKSGRMVSQDPVLEDVDEQAAANAGEAVALENLRLSEDSLPPEMKAILFQARINPRSGAQRQSSAMQKLKRVPSLRSNNMRRAAMISSGAAAHQSSHSQSTTASFDSNNPPPFPVPLRYSSARIGKSISEGGRSSPGSSNASPTKRPKGKNVKPMLRKARSGPAISPHSQARRARSRSPPVDPRVSIVPEMPSFQMPATTPAPFLAEPYSNPREASAPRPSIATGPSRRGTHTKTNSDAVSMHQTSVVDSIAQTMVGEWMYKYVRRRKSFGVTDKADWDANKSVEEISQSVTNNGVRHKRWVWLAPYERAVMWSSKQPTSGTALMGKSGRKCKSLLSYQDVIHVTNFASDDQICTRCQRRQSHAKGITDWTPLQPINPNPYSSTSTQIYCNFSRTTLCLVNCSIVPFTLPTQCE